MIKKDGLFYTDHLTQSNRCLHTPGSFAKQNLLYVQEVGTLQSIQPHRCVREKLDSFLFLVVLEGKGSLDINRHHFDVKAGDCVWLDCMEHYEHISDEEDAWKLAWVHFNGMVARSYYELFLKLNENCNMFYSEQSKRLGELIEHLREQQKEKSFLAELQCGELLLHILNCVIACVIDQDVVENEENQRLANEIREILNEQFADSHILAILQDVFEEQISTLNEIFLSAYGISIEEYISNRRYNAAKEMLRFSIKPVEQIARESGMGDIVAMQQMFRDNESMTAEEYRMRWAQWIR